MNRIMVTGDLHARFNRLSNTETPQLKSLDKDDYLIVCGDFGIWDDDPTERYWFDWMNNKKFTTLFVDGNHENFDRLYDMSVEMWHGGRVHKIRPNVIHLMRGEVFQIAGKKVFTMGGARSHDISDGILQPDDPKLLEKIYRFGLEGKYRYRINHVSWWRQEMPNFKEYDNAEQNLAWHKWEVDYVISHCAPSQVVDLMSGGQWEHDKLTDWLKYISETLDFKRWYFGHYHDNRYFGDQYVMLYENCIEAGEAWWQ